MLDWIGSLTVRDATDGRVVLGLKRTTRWIGLAAMALGGAAVAELWGVSLALALVPGSAAALGLVLATLERELVFDRREGVLTVRQRIIGIGTRFTVPLFHLRAVVVMAKPGMSAAGAGRARYVAYLDRRVGDSIFLDEAARCAGLLRMAEYIAEVAELRLEYDAGAA